MKAISVQQPWAWAIFRAGKNVENRRNKRGPAAAMAQFAPLAGTQVLIQSSGKYAGAEAFEEVRRLNRAATTEVVPGMPSRDPAWEFGSLLGLVTIGSVHTDDECRAVYTTGPDYWCSKWAWGNAAHIQITGTRLFRHPIAHPGQLGVWTVSDGLAIDRIRKDLAA